MDVPASITLPLHGSNAGLPPRGVADERIRTRLSIGRHLCISAKIAPLWFLANWSYNYSLRLLTVTTSTVISTTSCMWTYLLGVLLGIEAPTRLKFLGVALCVAGNVCSAFVGGDAGATAGLAGDSPLGVAVCAFGAAMYAVYTTAIRTEVDRAGGEGKVWMSVLLGCLGAVTSLALLPAVILDGLLGLEHLAGLTWNVLGCIVVKGLFDNVLSDYLWAKAVLYTSPTVATVGLTLTVPFAVVLDWLTGAAFPDVLSASGAGLVLGGFALLSC